MNKRNSKLQLSRETVRNLKASGLNGVAGGTIENCSGNGTCISDFRPCMSNMVPGMCDQSVGSECVSRCLACPDLPPSYAC